MSPKYDESYHIYHILSVILSIILSYHVFYFIFQSGIMHVYALNASYYFFIDNT